MLYYVNALFITASFPFPICGNVLRERKHAKEGKKIINMLNNKNRGRSKAIIVSRYTEKLRKGKEEENAINLCRVMIAKILFYSRQLRKARKKEKNVRRSFEWLQFSL